MSKSLFSPTNRLVVILSLISAAGAELLRIPAAFSEDVPNQEQADSIKNLFGFAQTLVSQTEKNDVSGSLFNASNTAKVSFQVQDSDGVVLYSVEPQFANEVPNDEGVALLAQLAAFASGEVAAAA